MRLLSARRRPDDGIPTSSMADIAFLLLIFFLVTTTFPKDKGLELVLPQENGEVSPDNVLLLFVGGGSQVEVRQGRAVQSIFVALDDLGDLWRARVAERPGLIAAVKTSADAPYGAMVDVLDALHVAGARRVSLELDTR